ncbi:MAG: GapR family DNA-binding domain-containing protein [Pseudomonadota bacterium]
MADEVAPGAVAADQLRTIIERIERLEEEKREITEQVKEVYAEAKANGYDTRILRKVVSLRKKDAEERQEEETLLEMYLSALGMR